MTKIFNGKGIEKFSKELKLSHVKNYEYLDPTDLYFYDDTKKMRSPYLFAKITYNEKNKKYKFETACRVRSERTTQFEFRRFHYLENALAWIRLERTLEKF